MLVHHGRRPSTRQTTHRRSTPDAARAGLRGRFVLLFYTEMQL